MQFITNFCGYIKRAAEELARDAAELVLFLFCTAELHECHFVFLSYSATFTGKSSGQ